MVGCRVGTGRIVEKYRNLAIAANHIDQIFISNFKNFPTNLWRQAQEDNDHGEKHEHPLLSI